MLYERDPATDVPFDEVTVITMVDAVTGMLNVAVTEVERDTEVAPAVGDLLVTVGAGGGTVENDHVTGAAITPPAEPVATNDTA